MLTLNMPPNLESRLRDEAAREGLEPDAFVVRAVERALTHTTPPGGGSQLSARESELLTKISIGLSDELWRRYRNLASKLDADKLSPSERTELLSITEAIELASAMRMRHLVELARPTSGRAAWSTDSPRSHPRSSSPSTGTPTAASRSTARA